MSLIIKLLGFFTKCYLLFALESPEALAWKNKQSKPKQNQKIFSSMMPKDFVQYLPLDLCNRLNRDNWKKIRKLLWVFISLNIKICITKFKLNPSTTIAEDWLVNNPDVVAMPHRTLEEFTFVNCGHLKKKKMLRPWLKI